MRILCVDDDRTSLSVLAHSLEHAFCEYEILQASSAEEAKGIIIEREIDIVITDHMMPGMSGLDLIDTMKRERPKTEFILTTAYSSVGAAVAAMQRGARDFMPKPLDSGLLIAKVRSLAQELKNKAHEEAQYEQNAKSEAERVRDLERQLAASREQGERTIEILCSDESADQKLELIGQLVVDCRTSRA